MCMDSHNSVLETLHKQIVALFSFLFYLHLLSPFFSRTYVLSFFFFLRFIPILTVPRAYILFWLIFSGTRLMLFCRKVATNNHDLRSTPIEEWPEPLFSFFYDSPRRYIFRLLSI